MCFALLASGQRTTRNAPCKRRSLSSSRCRAAWARALVDDAAGGAAPGLPGPLNPLLQPLDPLVQILASLLHAGAAPRLVRVGVPGQHREPESRRVIAQGL